MKNIIKVVCVLVSNIITFIFSQFINIFSDEIKLFIKTNVTPIFLVIGIIVIMVGLIIIVKIICNTVYRCKCISSEGSPPNNRINNHSRPNTDLRHNSTDVIYMGDEVLNPQNNFRRRPRNY